MQFSMQCREPADGQSAVNGTRLVLPPGLCGDVVTLYLSLGVQSVTCAVAKCIHALKIPVEVIETHVAEYEACRLKYILPVLLGSYCRVGQSIFAADLVGRGSSFLSYP